MNDSKKPLNFFSFMEFVLKRYSIMFVLSILFVLIAGFIEGLSISLFLPLLNFINAGMSVSGDPFSMRFFKIITMLGFKVNLEILLLFVVVLIILKNIFSVLQKIFVNQINIRFESDFKNRIFKSLAESSWLFVTKIQSGSIMNAVMNESKNAMVGFVYLNQVISGMIQVGIYLVVAIMISWRISMFALVFAVFLSFIYRAFSVKSRKIGYQSINLNNALQANVEETVLGMKYIKTTSLVGDFIDKFKGKVKFLLDVEKKFINLSAVLESLTEPLITLVVASGIFISIRYLHTPVPVILVLAFVFLRLSSNISRLQTVFYKISRHIASVDFCLKLIADAGENREKSGSRKFDSLKKSIRLQNVNFSYNRKNRIIKNISLNILKGQTVAFIGKTGCGKTTLVDLITGLILPQSGKITIDGIEISKFDHASYRHKIAFVPQETFLINDTIENNIKMNYPQASRQEMDAAVKMAYAEEFIDRQPEKFQTVIGDRGMRLSGGQKQRLALARALLTHPEILILDEATSALDYKSEKYIQKAINKIKGSLTMIIIAHRFSTIQNADRIYKIDTGRIVESGTFRQINLK
jgi:ABC-type multidrug transport system fused ATPase/permease subunit